MSSEFILEMTSITKEFPGVKALDDVSLSVRRGEIHALVGENGAGKSTLMKILSGAYPFGTYSGTISMEGENVTFKTVRDSEAHGISIVYQELMLYPDLTIGENIMLHSYDKIVSAEKTRREASKWMGIVGLTENPDTTVRSLGVGKKQLIEVAKALASNARLLILDEPTASLTDNEIRRLFGVLDSLRKEGVTCIYISHKIEEVFELCDGITVLRDGQTVSTMAIRETTESEVIKMMVGREINNRYPERVPGKCEQVALELKNFSVMDYTIQDKMLVDDVSFKVHYGEIVGIAGLMGAGRTELINSIFGDFKGKVSGDVYIDGERVKIRKTVDAIRNGIGLATEDRKFNGLNMVGNLDDNINVASLDKFSTLGVMNDNAATLSVNEMIRKTKLKAPTIKTQVMNLSGGNQQKTVISKWLTRKPKIMMFDEPTRGIDVGAKYEVYCMLNELKSEGIAIIVVSSELPEVLGISDRVLVMRQGKISAQFDIEDATPVKVMENAT